MLLKSHIFVNFPVFFLKIICGIRKASVVVVPGLWSTGSIVVHRLSHFEACEDLPGSGIEPMSPALV